MLAQLLFEEKIPLQQQAVVTRAGSTTWGQLRENAQRIANAYQVLAKRRVGLAFPSTAASYAALAALDKLACDVFILDARASLEETMRLSQKFRLGALLVPVVNKNSLEFAVHEIPNEEAWSGDHTVTILTSGSTGEPKAVRHSWASLSRPVRKDPENFAPRWLLAYRPNLYAGLQVMLQCFANRGTLCVIDDGMDSKAIARFICDTAVQFISATPSYWRRLLMFTDRDLLKKNSLVQITLGGEVVDQPILDSLHRLFPKSRLVHIYATTELGRCFSVGDGMAGFPTSYLDAKLPDGTQLQVRDSELLVHCPNSMTMYDPLSSQQVSALDWFATGDLTEIRGDRVYFVGRRTETINVAGSKVHPLEVEHVIRSVPGVADVRVFGKTSSIAGEIVGCEIIAAVDQVHNRLKEEIIRACRAQLASYQQPRLIKFVDRIDLSAAGKTIRSRTA